MSILFGALVCIALVVCACFTIGTALEQEIGRSILSMILTLVLTSYFTILVLQDMGMIV